MSLNLYALQGLLAQFAKHAGLWQAAVKAMAELDALMALAYAAHFGGEGAPMCRPHFVEPAATGSDATHVSYNTALCTGGQIVYSSFGPAV